MKHKILTLSVIAALSACGSSDDEKIIAPTAPEFFVINDNGEKETVETFAAVATKHAETGNPTGLYEISDLNPGESIFYPLVQVGTYGEFSINAKGEWAYALWRGDEFSATPEHVAITALVKKGLPDLTETFTVTTADGTTKDFTITIKGIDEPATFGGTLEKAASHCHPSAGGPSR